MSAKVFYQALGLKGYDVVASQETSVEISVIVEWPRSMWRCPNCRSHAVHLHDWSFRQWRNVPIGLKPTSVGMSVPRVKCQHCGACRRIPVKFAEGQTRHTKAYEKYAASLLQFMTPQDFARREGIAWDTAAAMDQRRLKKVPRQSLSQVKRIAIDEIYAGKLHKFMTIVLDLDSGQVVYVGAGRGSAALRPFVKKLLKSKAQIEAVAIDMAGGYIKAVKEFLPEATLVFDRFHITKLMNEKLTKLRRDEYTQATNQEHKDVLKGVRWLLLRKSETKSSKSKSSKLKVVGPTSNKFATEQRRLADLSRLKAALDVNQNLSTAYIMKGELALIWEQSSKALAKEYLDRWCARAEVTQIGVLKTMATTLKKHAAEIVNWYDKRISTGPLEGTNNKIKLMQRRAYGYRNRKHLILRIETLHTTRTILTG